MWEHGYRVYPVHPTLAEVEGDKAYVDGQPAGDARRG
ncbi:MAG: CoA-binding protein [Bacillota bacterium]